MVYQLARSQQQDKSGRLVILWPALLITFFITVTHTTHAETDILDYQFSQNETTAMLDNDTTPSLQASLEQYPPGKPAPPLRLRDTTGKVHDLRDYRGKTVLVNFWATWCPPCITEIPSLGRLQQRFSKEQFVVLSVDVEEKEQTVREFLNHTPAAYPVLLDPKGETIDSWSLFAFPATYLIDTNGDLRLAYFGGREWDNAETVQQLQRMFGLQVDT